MACVQEKWHVAVGGFLEQGVSSGAVQMRH